MTQTWSAADARQNWSELRNRARAGEDVVVQEHGKPDVVVIRYEDYQLVQAVLEDLRDAREVERIVALCEKDPSFARPYAEIRKHLIRKGLLDDEAGKREAGE